MYDTVRVVAEGLAAVLHITGLIPARNKYLYDLQIVVPGLVICVGEFKYYVCKITLCFLKKIKKERETRETRE